MTAPNHILGGIATVGIFASISGINILSRPIYLAIITIATLLPDIDHTRSLIGKLFYPIAKPLNRRFGHRTITHSLIFTISITLLVQLILQAFEINGPYAALFGAAYSSHLVFDMMTIQGVPLFYPFIRNPCVIPGKASLRLNTNNLRSETAIFCFFLLSLMFLQPLFSQGFWTSYNRLFGTMKHLRNEFKSTHDLLRCQVTYRTGTETYSLTGYVIDVENSKLLLYDSSSFITIGGPHQTIIRVVPEHTSLDLTYHTQSFYHLSADSLTSLVYEHSITTLEAASNHPFVATINKLTHTGKVISSEYINSFALSPALDTLSDPFYPNPAIHTHRKQLELLLAQEAQEQQILITAQETLQDLRNQAQFETDLIRKEALINQINQYRLPTPKDFSDPIARQKLQILQLEKADHIRYQQHHSNRSVDLPRYSGFFTYFTITPQSPDI